MERGLGYNISVEIKLTKNKVALVDEEDYSLVIHYNWYYHQGYARTNITINKTIIRIYMHRLILNVPKGLFTDHINKNTLDNRKKNLRIVTMTQNNWNLNRKGLSKYRGVSWDKNRNKWIAKISINNKTLNLGRYKTEQEAAYAYNKIAKKIRGKFAILNIF